MNGSGKVSRNRWNCIMRGSHLSQYLVQPLQRSMEMDLNPTWSTSYILTVILSTPSFHKWHSAAEKKMYDKKSKLSLIEGKNKLNTTYRIVHILVSSYTASKPWFTLCDSNWANSWLLKIFKEQEGGILHTVLGWKPWWWLQFRDWTNMALSDMHSA